jgi:hypothetical protein
MIRRFSSIEEIISRYSDLVARLREHDEVGTELLPVTETGTQVSLRFSDKNLAWVRISFQELARELMSETLREARFETTLGLDVHVLHITLKIVLADGHLIISSCKYKGAGGGIAGLPPGAVTSYTNLLAYLPIAQGTRFEDILALLNKLEEQGIEITAEATFFLNKNPLVAKLSKVASSPGGVFISVYLFPEKLRETLTRNALSVLESQFYKSDKKAVIVVFGARGVLQGDFLSVCGRCTANQLEAAFKNPDERKRGEFSERFDFRSRACNLQFSSYLMPESLSTTVIDADPGLLDVYYELKAWEAMLAIYSLANRVSKNKSGKYEVYFEGHRTVNFTVQRESIRDEYKKEYLREEGKKEANRQVTKQETSQEMKKVEDNQEERNVQAILTSYDLTYENASYDKLEMMRDVVTIYTDSWEGFIGKASKIGESSWASYQSYLKTKVESYFETRRKIRGLINSFAQETASEVARLTKEVNENIYKTAGLIAAAIIAVLIRPENTALILSIGGVVVVLFLLIILRYYLPTMLAQFENREKQYIDDVRSFAQVLEENEVEKFINDKTVKEQKELFLKKFARAKQFYYIASAFVVVALAVFFIVQQVASA